MHTLRFTAKRYWYYVVTEVCDVVGFVAQCNALCVGVDRLRCVVLGAEVFQQFARLPTVTPRRRSRAEEENPITQYFVIT